MSKYYKVSNSFLIASLLASVAKYYNKVPEPVIILFSAMISICELKSPDSFSRRVFSASLGAVSATLFTHCMDACLSGAYEELKAML